MSCDNKLITDEEKVVSWLWISFFYGSIIYTEDQIQMDSLSKWESLEYRPVSSLSFACSVLASSRNNTLHESSKMYVEHARHVASDRTQSLYPCSFYSGLGYDHQFINKQDARTRKKKKRQFEGRKQDWLVHKFVLRRPQRFNVIQAEPLFLFLNQQGSAQRVLE